MKYVEHIKTIALFLLIFLSLALTFSVWTFTPDYDEIEATPAVEVALGESKSVERVVKPHKVIYHGEEETKGTINQKQVDLLLNTMKEWQINEIMEVEEDASPALLKSYMHDPNRAVVYYPAPLPFPVLGSILQITDESLLEASFDRIVLVWGKSEQPEMTLYFINSRSGRIHKGNVVSAELNQFIPRIVEPALSDFDTYITEEGVGQMPIYLPENKLTVDTYRYLLEDIPDKKFVDGLFENPGQVESSGELTNEEYSDASEALMKFDDSKKSIRYVQPQAQTSDPAIPSELIFDTADWINSHSGWTNDYRYFSMEPLSQQINYRLYLNNLPVFSTALADSLELTWGIDGEMEQIFRYYRPYYVLESLGEPQPMELASGSSALHAVSHTKGLKPEAVTDVMLGYQMTRDEKDPDRLVVLEPTWFYKANGKWTPLSAEELGGDQFGLE
ncbi:YycH family regulatory protein [Planococcus chinensis]|uniref:YycH family regulatory protein n=1 Tax=Planococcus chinensis TaxID=272917 RepID=A0ABW4QIP2_9BACL